MFSERPGRQLPCGSAEKEGDNFLTSWAVTKFWSAHSSHFSKKKNCKHLIFKFLMVNLCSSDTIPSCKFKTMLPFICDSYSHFIVFVLDFHSPPPPHAFSLISTFIKFRTTLTYFRSSASGSELFASWYFTHLFWKRIYDHPENTSRVIPCSYLGRPLQLRHVCSVSRQLRFIDRQIDETTVNLSPYCFVRFLELILSRACGWYRIMASSTVVKKGSTTLTGNYSRVGSADWIHETLKCGHDMSSRLFLLPQADYEWPVETL